METCGQILGKYHCFSRERGKSGYHDRSDAENVFDELKAQWGWDGFTTRDLARNRVVARCVAVVYNLWSLYVRLGSPEAHREAKTSRPVLLRILGRLVHSGRQTTLHLVSGHARADRIEAFLTGIHKFFEALKANAERGREQQAQFFRRSRFLEKPERSRKNRTKRGFSPCLCVREEFGVCFPSGFTRRLARARGRSLRGFRSRGG
ncbi:MAG: transposase [Kiritimatiellae bacterium]|nr:transposase [Kiritimatiellia bacterium]